MNVPNLVAADHFGGAAIERMRSVLAGCKQEAERGLSNRKQACQSTADREDLNSLLGALN